MPTATFDVPHQLGKQEAKRRIALDFKLYRAQFIGRCPTSYVLPVERWEGDQVYVQGNSPCQQRIDARLDIFDDRVHTEFTGPTLTEAQLNRLTASAKRRLEKRLA
jgi:hypothetical protein